MTHSLIFEHPCTLKKILCRNGSKFHFPDYFLDFFLSLAFQNSGVTHICCEIKSLFHTYKIYSKSKWTLPVCQDKCGHGIYSHLFVLGSRWSTVIGIHVLLHDALPHFFSMYFGRIDLIVGPPPPSTPRPKKYVIRKHKLFAVCPLLNSIAMHSVSF